MILQHLTSVSRDSHYNLVWPHGGLEFATEARTPAMQAGLVGRRLTFRDIFTSMAGFLFRVALVIRSRNRHEGLMPYPVVA